jgi:tmRNA-binding protein
MQIQYLRVLPKYDILSYAVGAKDHEVVPEEIYYNKRAIENEVIKIMYGKRVHDKQQGVQSSQRLTSLKHRDLSSMISRTDC